MIDNFGTIPKVKAELMQFLGLFLLLIGVSAFKPKAGRLTAVSVLLSVQRMHQN